MYIENCQKLLKKISDPKFVASFRVIESIEKALRINKNDDENEIKIKGESFVTKYLSKKFAVVSFVTLKTKYYQVYVATNCFQQLSPSSGKLLRKIFKILNANIFKLYIIKSQVVERVPQTTDLISCIKLLSLLSDTVVSLR